jgi:hypothetical protein
LALVVMLASEGCMTSPEEVVRTSASEDFHCPAENIKLTALDAGKRKHSYNGKFLATGCGKSDNYVCNDWDSYNQAPVCHPGTD